MIRLCFLADAPYVHSQRWLRYFATRGYEVHVITFRDARIPGVCVHHIDGLEALGKGRYLVQAPRVRRLIHALRPDLLHAMHLTSYGFLAALSGRHPLVTSVWGHDVFVVPQWTPLHLLITRYALAKADIVTATGPRMARAAARYAPKGKRIAVVPYGVDLNRFQPSPRPARDRVVIGWLGRLSPEKGLRYLIEAAALALQERPNLEFLLIGDGPERMTLAQLATRLGIADRLRFQGAVPHETVAAALQRMDIFALPSLAEGFGVAAVEAAAMELPVIGTNTQGIPDVVKDGETGLLVPPKDPRALADAILSLAADPERRHQMGRAGRAFVAERYNWQANAAEMERVYAQALQLSQQCKVKH